MKISFLFLCLLITLVHAKLRVDFYEKSCPKAETIIKNEVSKLFKADRSVPAALLRIHFHDCMIGGCDASILIDSTPEKQSEKIAAQNSNVRGFDLVDIIKAKVEDACPGTVSCADVLTLATRDSLVLAGGTNYVIPTGRLDSLDSDAEIVDLPSSSDPVESVLHFFKTKGYNAAEAVALMGGHSIGNAHCGSFDFRLEEKNRKADPTMDPALASKLAKICKKPHKSDPATFLDQATPFTMDNFFYKEIKRGRGVLEIDQELALHNSTAKMVSMFAKKASWWEKSFADVMVKLGTHDVITGTKGGEVRKDCRKFNKR